MEEITYGELLAALQKLDDEQLKSPALIINIDTGYVYGLKDTLALRNLEANYPNTKVSEEDVRSVIEIDEIVEYLGDEEREFNKYPLLVIGDD